MPKPEPSVRIAPRILDAFAEGSDVKVWCDFCERWHHHGGSFDHRVAHCSCVRSPYAEDGYLLRDARDQTPLPRRESKGAMCAKQGFLQNCVYCPGARWDKKHVTWELENKRGEYMQTVLHRNGDQYAIVTVAETEDEFRTQFVSALNALAIETTGGSDPVEREAMINGWLKPAIEVACKYRGYKSEVVERRTLIAGHIDPDAPMFSAGDLTAPVTAEQ